MQSKENTNIIKTISKEKFNTYRNCFSEIPPFLGHELAWFSDFEEKILATIFFDRMIFNYSAIIFEQDAKGQFSITISEDELPSRDDAIQWIIEEVQVRQKKEKPVNIFQNNSSCNFVNNSFAVFPGKISFQQRIFCCHGGKPFILKENSKACFLQLSAEIPDFLSLKSFGSVHVQWKAGNHKGGFIPFTDCFDCPGIRSPTDPGDYFHRGGDSPGGIGYGNTDPNITDIQSYNSFVHVS